MWGFWRWVYARLYLRTQKRWPGQESPSWSAVAGLSFAMNFNAFSIVVVLISVTGYRLTGESKVYAAGFAAAVVALNAWRFIIRRDADGLIRRLSTETPDDAQRESVKLWLYLVGSPVATAGLAWILLRPR